MPKQANRKLLIAVPTAPGGSVHVNLLNWLIAVSVESEVRRAICAIKDSLSDLQDRLRLGKVAETAGVGWVEKTMRIQWSHHALFGAARTPMVPPGWDVDVTQVGGRPIPANRNDIAKMTLMTVDPASQRGNRKPKLVPTAYDAVLMIDSDCVPGQLDLVRICEDLDRDDIDIVSGVYCMRGRDGYAAPIVYEQVSGRSGVFCNDGLVSEEEVFTRPNLALPAGFLAIKRYVLEEMVEQDRVWFKDVFHDGSLEAFEVATVLEASRESPEKAVEMLKEIHGQRMKEDWGEWASIGGWRTGEDIWFCIQARACGFQLWLDKRIHVSHYKDIDMKKLFRAQDQLVKIGFGRGRDLDDPDEVEKQYYAMMRKQALAKDRQSKEKILAGAAAGAGKE